MAAIAFYWPVLGTPTAEGNLLSFFIAGTSTSTPVYSDSDLSVAIAQPIELNAAGQPSVGVIYLPSTPGLKIVYTDGDGVAIAGYPADFVSPAEVAS